MAIFSGLVVLQAGTCDTNATKAGLDRGKDAVESLGRGRKVELDQDLVGLLDLVEEWSGPAVAVGGDPEVHDVRIRF